jgi:putative PIN family toxin of toxin-antitoxin system
MTPQVFVVDTNVVAAGLITRSADSPVVAILDAMLAGTLLYLLSPSLLAEYQAVLSRPKLLALHGLSQQEIEQLLVELTGNAIWRDPQDGPPAPDRGDDHLWVLLRAHSGSTLITGDQLLLEQPPEGASVITPRSWFDRLPSSAR